MPPPLLLLFLSHPSSLHSPSSLISPLYPLPAQVVKVKPHDKDAKMKYQECNKIVKQKAFERAIAGDEHKRSVVDSLDIESMSESGPDFSHTHSRTFHILAWPLHSLCTLWGGELGLRSGLWSLFPRCCLLLPYLPSREIRSPGVGLEFPVWELWASTSSSCHPSRASCVCFVSRSPRHADNSLIHATANC